MRLQHDNDGAILVCPCEDWQVQVSSEVILSMHPAELADTVEEAILGHLDECIVLAASRMTADAARGR